MVDLQMKIMYIVLDTDIERGKWNMITYKDSQPHTQRSQVMGGPGSYDQRSLFTPDQCAKTRLFSVLTMPTGSGIGEHSHTGEGEAYIVLKGQAVVTEDGQEYILNPGDAEYCTDGHTHSVRNAGPETLELLAVIML